MKNKFIGEVDVTIHAPASEVWEALTTPEIIQQYFFGTHATSDFKAGSPIVFEGEWEGKTYQDKGTVLGVIPGKLFRYTYWSSMSGIEDKPENYATITYTLWEMKSHTLLAVTQDNIPDEKMKQHSEKNWKQVMANLKGLLEKSLARY